MRNLPRLAVLLAAGVPLVASAHPGHGDHDFTWEFSHLVAHPVATVLCFVMLATVAWTIWHLTRADKKAKSKTSR